MIMLIGCHRRHSIEMLTDEDGVEKAANLLSMRDALQVDGKQIFAPQEIELSKIADASTAIMRLKAAFTEAMKNLLSYERASQEKYSV